MNLTHKNHFKFGYNEEWFRSRQNAEDVYTVKFGRCKRKPKDFRTESMKAAQLIGENSDHIHVLYSGGVDSEVAMLSFMVAKIPVTAAIMRFDNNYNAHDITYAVRFCERNQVSYKLYDINIVKFLENKALDYMVATKCTSPMTAATMWLVDQIQGYPVIGQGECYLIKPNHITRVKEARVTSYQDKEFADDDWALQESEMMNAWYRHFLLKNRNGVPGFHQYTPEQILSYITDANVVAMMKSDNKSSDTSKLSIYQRHFDLASRMKYTGYENYLVSPLINNLHTYLLQIFSNYQNIFLTEYKLLKSQLEHK